MYRKKNDWERAMSHSSFYKEDHPGDYSHSHPYSHPHPHHHHQHHQHPHRHHQQQHHSHLDGTTNMGLGMGLGLGVEEFNGVPGIEIATMKEEPDSSDAQATAMHLINEPQFIFEFPGQDEENVHNNTTLRHDSASSPSFEFVPISASLSLPSPLSNLLSSNTYNNNDNTNDASTSDLLLDESFASSSHPPLLRPGSPTTEAMRSMMSVFRVDPFASYDADAGSHKKRKKRGSSYARLSDPEQTSKEEPLMFTFQIQGTPGSEYHINYDLASSMLDSFSQTPSPSSPSSLDVRQSYHHHFQDNSSTDYGAFLQSHDPQDLSSMILASDAAVAEQASTADTRFTNFYTTYPRQHTSFQNLPMINNAFSSSHHLLHNPNPNPPGSSDNANPNYMLQNMQQSTSMNLGNLGMGMNMMGMGMNTITMGLGSGSYPTSSASSTLPSLESITSVPVSVSMPAAMSMDNLSDANLPPMDSLSVSVSQLTNIMENQGDNVSWSTTPAHSQSHTRHAGQNQDQGFGSRHSLSRSDNGQEQEFNLPLTLDFSRLHKMQGGIVQQDAAKQMYQAEQEREEERRGQSPKENGNGNVNENGDGDSGKADPESGCRGGTLENLYLMDNNLELGRVDDHNHDNNDDENDELELGERDRDSEVRDLMGGLVYPSPMPVHEEDDIDEKKRGFEGSEVGCVSGPLTVSNRGGYYSEQDDSRFMATSFASSSSQERPPQSWQTTGTSSPTYPLYSARFDCDFDSVSISEAVDDGEIETDVDCQRLGRGHGHGRVTGTITAGKHHDAVQAEQDGNNAKQKDGASTTITTTTASVYSKEVAAGITPAPGGWTGNGGDGTLVSPTVPTPTSANSEVEAETGAAKSEFEPGAQRDRHNRSRDSGFAGIRAGAGTGTEVLRLSGHHANEGAPGITPSQSSSTSVSSSSCPQSPYNNSSQVESSTTSHIISDYLNQYYENVNASRIKINVEPEHAGPGDHSTQYYGGGAELAIPNQYGYGGVDYQGSVTSELSVAAMHSTLSREDGAFMLSPSFTYSSSAASSTSMTLLTNNANGGSASASGSTKMHICWICHKEFPRPSGLATHMNTHSGLKPYKCPITSCAKTFAVRSNARRHLRIHGIGMRAGVNVLKSSLNNNIGAAGVGLDGCSTEFGSTAKFYNEIERYHTHESFEFSQSPPTWRSLSLTPPLSLPEKPGRSLSPSFKHRDGDSVVSERQSKGWCGVYPYPHFEDTSHRHFPLPRPDSQVPSSPGSRVPHSASHPVSSSSPEPPSYSYSNLKVSQSHMDDLDGNVARHSCVQGEFGLGTLGKIESPEPDGPFQLDSLCIPTRRNDENERQGHSTTMVTPVPMNRGGGGLTPTRRPASTSTCTSGAEGANSNMHTPTLSTISTASTASSMIDDSNPTAVFHASYSAHTGSTPTTTTSGVAVGDLSLLPPATRYVPTPASMLTSSASAQARMHIPVYMPVAYHVF